MAAKETGCSNTGNPSRNLTSMTERMVLRYTSFPDLQSYLSGYAIVGPALAGLSVPSRIITALDDPLIPASDLGRLAAPAALSIVATRRGGHCGFLEGLAGETWADRQLHAALTAP